jgi:hypothetical protein
MNEGLSQGFGELFCTECVSRCPHFKIILESPAIADALCHINRSIELIIPNNALSTSHRRSSSVPEFEIR